MVSGSQVFERGNGRKRISSCLKFEQDVSGVLRCTRGSFFLLHTFVLLLCARSRLPHAKSRGMQAGRQAGEQRRWFHSAFWRAYGEGVGLARLLSTLQKMGRTASRMFFQAASDLESYPQEN